MASTKGGGKSSGSKKASGGGKSSRGKNGKKSGGGASGGGSTPRPTDQEGRLSVLVELEAGAGLSPAAALGMAGEIDVPGFQVDREYEPVPMGGSRPGMAAARPPTVIVRGTVADEDEMESLRSKSGVVGVWLDTPIAPFPGAGTLADPGVEPAEADEGMGACPIPPCDCSPGTAKGTLADVATYLGVTQIWAQGYKGSGIVIGIVDSGITAQGRPVKAGETSDRIPRVIGGWPSDWGTESSDWGNHGNMTSTDALGMAPEAQIYDLRVSGTGGSPGTISRAIQAFQWAINRHQIDGTPHILSNSWGIFQQSWDPTYASNPNHPFVRKVEDALDEGILVLFAAGNCGDVCPDWRCGSDTGTGSSIWGANGHPRVMTVAAVNKNEQYIGYSSVGPAALDPNKPDFAGISHFKGYFASDSGTSAATPVVAGVVALMKQGKSSLSQADAKKCLKDTAKDLGPAGWDIYTGAGVIRAKAAFDKCRGRIFKLPSRDTLPFIDRIMTLPWLERGGTLPSIDWVKSPMLDTLEERLKPIGDQIRDPWRWLIQPGLGGATPFALSTPHQYEGWEEMEQAMGGGMGAGGADAADVDAMLEYLEGLSEQIQATIDALKQGTDGEES